MCIDKQERNTTPLTGNKYTFNVKYDNPTQLLCGLVDLEIMIVYCAQLKHLYAFYKFVFFVNTLRGNLLKFNFINFQIESKSEIQSVEWNFLIKNFSKIRNEVNTTY